MIFKIVNLLPESGKKFRKTLLIMKLMAFFLLAGCLQLSAAGIAQNITLGEKKASLQKVFKEINRQTGYQFFYKDALLKKAGKITIEVTNTSLEKVLELCFKDLPIAYSIVDKAIVLREKQQVPLDLQVQNAALVPPAIKGIVQDEKGLPISGVSVLVQGTKRGTSTGANGEFTIDAKEGEVLEFSSVGYQKVSITVGTGTSISIKMEVEAVAGSEIVVVGYGTAKRKDLTGSITRLSSKDIQNKAVNNPLELLRGTVAGFNSNMSTSAKGGGSMEIRGQKSLKASNSPLLVVDGVIYNGALDDINPYDIEAMDILKDGSAAAVYGSRAANGVLVITTKKGTSDKPVISIESKVGVSQLLRKQPVYSGEDYIRVKGDAQRSLGGFTRPEYYYRDPRKLPAGVDMNTWLAGQTGDPVDIWLSSRLVMQPTEKANYLAGKTTDWMDQVFQNGLRQDYNVSIAGRSNKVNYYWSVGSANVQGIVSGDQYKTIRSRLNLSADVNKFLQVGASLQFTSRNESTNPANWGAAVTASPYGTKYEANGTLKYFPHDDNLSANPFNNAAADLLNTTNSLIANPFAIIKLPFNIKYQVTFNNRIESQKVYQFYGSDTYDGRPLPGPTPGILLSGKGSRQDVSVYAWQLDHLLTWSKAFGQHKIDVTALINAEKNRSWSGTVSASQFDPSDALGYNNLGVGTQANLTTSNSDSYSTGDAMMLRTNYSYKDRYLLTASIRRDGYSAFGLKNPRANFPGLAFAWKLSNEGFMDKVDWVKDLKVRLSYGTNGNRSIPIYGALATVTNSRIIINGQPAIAITNNTLANEDLRWERTSAYNAGLDFTIFKGRLQGTVDAYYMSTTDLLLDRSLPSIIGFKSVLSNIGEVTNKGFELNLNSTNIVRKNFKWSSNLVFSLNRNQIKHLYGNMMDVTDTSGKVTGRREADDVTNGWYIGHAIDQIFNYNVTGVWQTAEATEAAKYGRKPGDMKLQDVTNTGGVLAINTLDRTFQGYTKPRYRLGLRNDFEIFENYFLSFFLRADLAFYGSNSNYLHTQNGGYYERLNSYAYSYWTPENPVNDGARLNSGFNPAPGIYRNSSFVRLQDITFSYNLPKNLVSKLKLQNARVYANVNNAFTITDWDYWDPETKAPTPRNFTLGVNFSF